jgi:hypothetical protein
LAEESPIDEFELTLSSGTLTDGEWEGTFTLPEGYSDGQYSLTVGFISSDNRVSFRQTEIQIHNPNYNSHPIANAGIDFEVEEGSSGVLLDGTGSIDLDGEIVQYLWEQVEGSTLVEISDADQVTPTIDIPMVDADTSLVFKLTVTDNEGASSEAIVFVTIVQATDVTPPVLTMPEEIVIEAESSQGTSVEFVVSASDDNDGETSVVCDHQSNLVYPLGETVVKCTATDSAANTSEGEFIIKVRQQTRTQMAGTRQTSQFTLLPRTLFRGLHQYQRTRYCLQRGQDSQSLDLQAIMLAIQRNS